MILDDRVFLEEYFKIANAKRYNQFWTYTAKFIYDRENVLPIVNIVDLNIASAFDRAVSDYFMISVQVNKSVYSKLMEINRNLLKIELTKKSTSYTGSTEVGPSIMYTQLFDAYLPHISSEAVKSLDGGFTGDYRDDMTNLVELDVQLLEEGFAEFSKMDIGGVYPNTDLENLIKNLMTIPLKTLKNAKEQSYRVDIVKPDNDKVYYQLRMDSGHALPELPGRLQKSQGLYATGCGYFLQRKCWYVWPLFHIKRFDKVSKKLIIINVPPNEMLGNNQSYAQFENVLYIYATGDTNHIDMSDSSKLNKGTAIRYVKMENLADKFVSVKNGKATIDAGRNLVTMSFDDKEKEVSAIKPVEGMVSSNPWDDTSKLVSGFGSVIEVQWEYSDPSLLYPGMPLKFIYKKGKVPYSIMGTLIGVHTAIKTVLQSPTDKRYISHSVLSLYCESATK
jgi:hypothetical protein